MGNNNNIYIQRSREEKSKLITKSIFILMGKNVNNKHGGIM